MFIQGVFQSRAMDFIFNTPAIRHAGAALSCRYGSKGCPGVFARHSNRKGLIVRSSHWLLFLACLVSAGQLSADDNWVPFSVDWSVTVDSPADMSFLLVAPAGKDGPIVVRDGHLCYPDGSRFRVWGVNATGGATVPAKEHAPVIARRLAQYGINCVRFHFLDRYAPDGLIAAQRPDSRTLDPAQLDRFDFFVAELKNVGIYSNINLNVGRTYRAGDGVRDWELLGFAKALTYFDPRLRELQQEYARQLLSHRNAYTGAEYRHEPAVATVELVNENSLVESWFSGRLLGKNTTKNPGTWTDIPAGYERQLTEQYNEWLLKRLPPAELAALRKQAGIQEGEPVPRLAPGEFSAASAQRFLTEAKFYVDMERTYFEDMGRLLKEELGVYAPVVGTSDHNHGRSGYPLLSSTSLLDIVDGHVYWQHPRYLTNAQGRRSGFAITNSPMVDDPLHSTVVELSRSAVAGRPYTVSEVGHPFPSEFACEGIPILAAYAALHDWDGIYWYTLAHRDVVVAGSSTIGHFDLYADPVKMAQLAAGALLFLRPDVKPAVATLNRSYTPEQVLESLRLEWKDRPYFTPGFSLSLPLRSATRISSFQGPATGPCTDAALDPLVSDTGELSWFRPDKGQGLVTINTPRSQAIVGHCAANRKEADNLAARMETKFCAVTLSALDQQPIAQSTRLLLTCAARVENTGMVWNGDRTSLTDWGHAPTLLEPVRGTIELRNLQAVVAVSAQPLDGAGRPLGDPIAAQQQAAGWSFELGNPSSPWWVLSVKR